MIKKIYQKPAESMNLSRVDIQNKTYPSNTVSFFRESLLFRGRMKSIGQENQVNSYLTFTLQALGGLASAW